MLALSVVLWQPSARALSCAHYSPADILGKDGHVIVAGRVRSLTKNTELDPNVYYEVKVSNHYKGPAAGEVIQVEGRAKGPFKPAELKKGGIRYLMVLMHDAQHDVYWFNACSHVMPFDERSEWLVTLGRALKQ